MGRLDVVLRAVARTLGQAPGRPGGTPRPGHSRSPSDDSLVGWRRAREVLATPAHVAGADLYTVERLEQHAQVLAATHRLGPRGGARPSLLEVVDASEELVRAVRSTLARASRDAEVLSPAAAWLLDNAYLVDEEIREVRHDLPAGYYAELPKLADGPCRGHPRVYALALELVAHTDARIDPEQLVRFVLAYDAITPLTMGELWAVAIMLRIGLLASLGRQAADILDTHATRTEADAWVDRLLTPGLPDAAAERAFASLRARYPRLPPALALRLLWRLEGEERGAATASVVEQIERELVAQYGGVEAVYHAEHQRQATSQASVSNAITSLRTLDAIDWPEWFERVSRVEQMLRQDPAGAHAH